METNRRAGAVVYLRVSTEEQASGAYNLGNQEKRCRDYCDQRGLSVVEVFTDPGESARDTDRPQFQQMLQFCERNRRIVGFVVVQDLSRLARNLQHQAETITALRTLGILLRSTYEINIDETAAGKLAANIHGSYNQFFSDSLSEKMRDRTRAAVNQGRFPWPAPIGYLNIKTATGSIIAPDPDRAPLVREAFELTASGQYKLAEVQRIISDRGLRTRKNAVLSAQTLNSMLRKPVYCGWICPPSMNDIRIKGAHEAIVSEDLFQQTQRVLDGKAPIAIARQKHNPSLPLKCFVKCEVCGTPLTGGFARGRTKLYPRYWCRKQGCLAVKLAKEKLESEFVAVLNRLKPSRGTASALPKIAAKVWAEKEGEAETMIAKLTACLEEQKALKAELLKAKLRQEVSQADYEQANAEYAADIARTEELLKAAVSSRSTLETFLRFSELLLMDIARAWEIAGPEQRQRVQNLLFQDGLYYSPTSGILNRSNSSLFTMLEQMSHEKCMLASPTGFEPVLPP